MLGEPLVEVGCGMRQNFTLQCLWASSYLPQHDIMYELML